MTYFSEQVKQSISRSPVNQLFGFASWAGIQNNMRGKLNDFKFKIAGHLEFEVIQFAPHIVLKSCSTSVPKKLIDRRSSIWINQSVNDLDPSSLGRPNRSNSIWPAILNLKSVNLNLILFWNPAPLVHLPWNYIGMTTTLEFELNNWSMTYLYPCFLQKPNRSKSLWQATLNLILIVLILILFWNPAHWCTLLTFDFGLIVNLEFESTNRSMT